MAVAALASCESVLDSVAPKHAVTTDTVGEADLSKLTNGVLYTMEGFFSNNWYDGDKMGEALENGPGKQCFAKARQPLNSSTIWSGRTIK